MASTTSSSSSSRWTLLLLGTAAVGLCALNVGLALGTWWGARASSAGQSRASNTGKSANARDARRAGVGLRRRANNAPTSNKATTSVAVAGGGGGRVGSSSSSNPKSKTPPSPPLAAPTATGQPFRQPPPPPQPSPSTETTTEDGGVHESSSSSTSSTESTNASRSDLHHHHQSPLIPDPTAAPPLFSSPGGHNTTSSAQRLSSSTENMAPPLPPPTLEWRMEEDSDDDTSDNNEQPTSKNRRGVGAAKERGGGGGGLTTAAATSAGAGSCFIAPTLPSNNPTSPEAVEGAGQAGLLGLDFNRSSQPFSGSSVSAEISSPGSLFASSNNPPPPPVPPSQLPTAAPQPFDPQALLKSLTAGGESGDTPATTMSLFSHHTPGAGGSGGGALGGSSLWGSLPQTTKPMTTLPTMMGMLAPQHSGVGMDAGPPPPAEMRGIRAELSDSSDSSDMENNHPGGNRFRANSPLGGGGLSGLNNQPQQRGPSALLSQENVPFGGNLQGRSDPRLIVNNSLRGPPSGPSGNLSSQPPQPIFPNPIGRTTVPQQQPQPQISVGPPPVPPVIPAAANLMAQQKLAAAMLSHTGGGGGRGIPPNRPLGFSLPPPQPQQPQAPNRSGGLDEGGEDSLGLIAAAAANLLNNTGNHPNTRVGGGVGGGGIPSLGPSDLLDIDAQQLRAISQLLGQQQNQQQQQSQQPQQQQLEGLLLLLAHDKALQAQLRNAAGAAAANALLQPASIAPKAPPQQPNAASFSGGGGQSNQHVGPTPLFPASLLAMEAAAAAAAATVGNTANNTNNNSRGAGGFDLDGFGDGPTNLATAAGGGVNSSSAASGGAGGSGANSANGAIPNPLIGASARLGVTLKPPLSFFNTVAVADMLLISAQLPIKSLAGNLAVRMRKGEPVIALVSPNDGGFENANHTLKSLCVAQNFLKLNHIDICCRVEWAEGTLAILCFPGAHYKEADQPPNELAIRIAGKSAPPPIHTAGLIANRLREYTLCFLLVMGAESVVQAMRSMCVVHNFIGNDDPIWFSPKFITMASPTGNRSGMQIFVHQKPPTTPSIVHPGAPQPSSSVSSS